MSDDRRFLTNAYVYLAIAEDALRASHHALVRHRQPNPNNADGSIFQIDPEQTSFKQSMIALAFAGMFYEAITYTAGKRQGLSKSKLMRLCQNPYHEKLSVLGFNDEILNTDLSRFRLARNDLIHEKALDLMSGSIRAGKGNFNAQDEADFAISLVKRIDALLKENSTN